MEWEVLDLVLHMYSETLFVNPRIWNFNQHAVFSTQISQNETILSMKLAMLAVETSTPEKRF